MDQIDIWIKSNKNIDTYLEVSYISELLGAIFFLENLSFSEVGNEGVLLLFSMKR